jgi:hypothetical protein
MEDNKEEFNNELDPEIIKIRDQIIAKIGDKPLDEINLIIKKLLREQMDEVTRLGALAARVKIIRAKIKELYEIKNITKKKPQKIHKKVEVPKKAEKAEEWLRVKMLESAEVNGKQVDSGVVLDVKLEEAKKLITLKKAEEVKEKAKEVKDEDKKIESKKEEKSEEKVKVEEELKTDSSKQKEVETKEPEQEKEIKDVENKVELKKEEGEKEIQLEEPKDKKEVTVEETEKKEAKPEGKKEKIDLSEDLLKVHEEKEIKPEKDGSEEKKEKIDLSEDLLKVHEEKVQKK